jgi:hypothetical protein
MIENIVLSKFLIQNVPMGCYRKSLKQSTWKKQNKKNQCKEIKEIQLFSNLLFYLKNLIVLD